MAVGFYAGLKRSERQCSLLLGPFSTKAEAEAVLDAAHDRATEIDKWCHFDVRGVFRLERESLPLGILNGKMGVALS